MERLYKELQDDMLACNKCRATIKLQQQLDQLKAKNNELKAQNIKYMNGNISYQLKNSLYRQTLIEIKEFLQSDYCTEIASCEFCAEAENCLNRKILQKISECEVEDGFRY